MNAQENEIKKIRILSGSYWKSTETGKNESTPSSQQHGVVVCCGEREKERKYSAFWNIEPNVMPFLNCDIVIFFVSSESKYLYAHTDIYS